MSNKKEVIWHVSGTVVETTRNLGNRNKTYWQILLEVDGGFVCLYVRNEALFSITENFAVGQKLEASGRVKPRKSLAEAKRPLFLDPVEQLSPVH